MGNQKKKGFHEKRKCSNAVGDVTLNDFANVAVSGKTRMRKQAARLSISENKDSLNEVMDAENDKILAEQEEMKTRQRKKTFEGKEGETGTNVYPLDVWCLLSKYIGPEDVGRFAGICRNANQAIHCASFWFNLYRRYYKKAKDLPERLQPECMTRLHGLKSCVIRSLYFLYPPLASKYFVDPPGIPPPAQKFLSRKCSSVWREVNGWKFTYNFILVRQNPISRSKTSNSVPGLLSTLGDIYANDAQDSVMLQVVSKRYMDTPEVLGLHLIRVTYDYEEVILVFSRNTYSSYDDKEVKLRHAEKIRAHNWWSPYYPHSDRLISNATDNEEY